MANHVVLQNLLAEYSMQLRLQSNERLFEEQETILKKQMAFLQEFGCESQFRTNLAGHFTASIFIADLHHQKCLLLWHEKLQKWLQPGGHIELEDNDIFASALREGYEETAVVKLDFYSRDIFDLDVHPIPARPTEPEHLHYDVRFLCVADSTLPLEISDTKWIEFNKVADVTSEPSILRLVHKLTPRSNFLCRDAPK